MSHLEGTQRHPGVLNGHAADIAKGERFAFGKNWARFLATLNEDRITQATNSLIEKLGVQDLRGKTFLDIGSGSGLFSLAARRLGARVHSFDYDPDSVNCTRELRRRYFGDDPAWRVEEGSALDLDYLRSLGKFDIVYSWGVLHHTGEMWRALDHAAEAVARGGSLFIAIYNDQGTPSVRWKKAKRLYNRLPRGLRFLVVVPSFFVLNWHHLVKDILRLRPFETIRNYGKERGMSFWRDLIDWVGGYPFEVATPKQIFDFYKARGFELFWISTCAGNLGCNEFVFREAGRRALSPAAGEGTLSGSN
jgi:2-polyprenyl-6-hydroxyphenyl methylase/3-demethylubiquinone-9 3-methyltransferase